MESGIIIVIDKLTTCEPHMRTYTAYENIYAQKENFGLNLLQLQRQPKNKPKD